MSSISSILNSGLSGLNAAQAGMATTQHNIANANTPGYSMQQIVQAANTAQYTGSGFIGQGTDVTTVQRVYNDFLNTQLLQAQSQASQLGTYQTQVTQIDNLLGGTTTGLSSALQGFFNSMNTVASSPNSVPARQSLLSSAQSLTTQFQSLSQQLTSISTGLNGQIRTSVSTVNSLAQQIATLNQSIVSAQATGQPPNDLLDQRDQLVSQLNQQIKATVVKQSDGSYNVFVGSGQSLVVGNQAFGLTTAPSLTDPTRTEVAYTANGTTIPLQQSSIQGGVLGGLLAFRDQSLNPALNALGQVAIGVATSVNQQNQLGQDLNGALGGNIFTVSSPVVNAASNNAGNAVISASISNSNALTTSDYTLKFNGGTSYTLTRLSDNTVTAISALPQTVDGVTLNLSSGSAVAGDTFLIRPTVMGAQSIAMATNDPAKIAAAAPILASAALTNTGSGVIGNGSVVPPAPPNANLQTSVSITFTTPTTFTVSGAVPAVAGTVAYASGQTISYNGWTTQLSGTPAAGDVFNIAANINGTGDNRNALLMAGLQNQNTLSGGTSSFQGAYAQLVAQIGNTTSAITQSSTTQTTMVNQLVQSQQSVSGVNLDQEAANLMRYQRAYQAAGKAIQVANTLFDTLLTLR